jgi:hypothetical protein
VLAMRRTINALHSSYLILTPFFLISDGAESCKYCGITAAGTSLPSEDSNTDSYDRSGVCPSPANLHCSNAPF